MNTVGKFEGELVKHQTKVSSVLFVKLDSHVTHEKSMNSIV